MYGLLTYELWFYAVKLCAFVTFFQVIIEGFKSYKEQVATEPFSSKHNCVGMCPSCSFSPDDAKILFFHLIKLSISMSDLQGNRWKNVIFSFLLREAQLCWCAPFLLILLPYMLSFSPINHPPLCHFSLETNTELWFPFDLKCYKELNLSSTTTPILLYTFPAPFIHPHYVCIICVHYSPSWHFRMEAFVIIIYIFPFL